jgi:hypothetical protein
MNFEEIIGALKEGKMARRYCWNNGVFIFMQVPSTIHKSIVPKMQSLPQSVKDEFEKRFNDPAEQIDAIYYDDQIAIVGPSNCIRGWSPSVEDIFASNWTIMQ